jgi:hypothetical protein
LRAVAISSRSGKVYPGMTSNRALPEVAFAQAGFVIEWGVRQIGLPEPVTRLRRRVAAVVVKAPRAPWAVLLRLAHRCQRERVPMSPWPDTIGPVSEPTDVEQPELTLTAAGSGAGPSTLSRVAFEPLGDRVRVHVAPSQGGVDTPVFLGKIALKTADDMVNVTLYERDGSKVLIRQVDPCDVDSGPVEIFDGDEIQLMEAISHIGLNTNSGVGSVDGFMFGMRVVPDRVEGTTVYARSLRRGETDDGRRVHTIPGGNLTFAAGSIVAELDHIDDQLPPTSSGHVPLTPSLWTWLSLGDGHDESKTRYVLAAARRLDTANLLLIEVQTRIDALNQAGIAGPAIRLNLFEMVGTVEQAVIALGRALDMVMKTNQVIGRRVPVPKQLSRASTKVTAIRNAYEHIEDRAVGKVRGKPDPDALTIFDWRRLITEQVVVYGTQELDLAAEAPALIAAMRQYFKDAVTDG